MILQTELPIRIYVNWRKCLRASGAFERPIFAAVISVGRALFNYFQMRIAAWASAPAIYAGVGSEMLLEPLQPAIQCEKVFEPIEQKFKNIHLASYSGWMGGPSRGFKRGWAISSALNVDLENCQEVAL